MFTCGIVLVILVLLILTLYKIDKKETYSSVTPLSWKQMIDGYSQFIKPTCEQGSPQCPPFWSTTDTDCGPDSKCTPSAFSNTNEIGGGCFSNYDCDNKTYPLYCSYGFCTVDNDVPTGEKSSKKFGQYASNIIYNQCVKTIDSQGNIIPGREQCDQIYFNFQPKQNELQCSSDILGKPGLCFIGKNY